MKKTPFFALLLLLPCLLFSQSTYFDVIESDSFYDPNKASNVWAVYTTKNEERLDACLTPSLSQEDSAQATVRCAQTASGKNQVKTNWQRSHGRWDERCGHLPEAQVFAGVDQIVVRKSSIQLLLLSAWGGTCSFSSGQFR